MMVERMWTSSDEDDEVDAAKLAALRSVAIDSADVIHIASAGPTSFRGRSSGASRNGNGNGGVRGSEESDGKDASGGLKLYQIRLQDLLYKHLDKTFGASIDDDDTAVPDGPAQRESDEFVEGAKTCSIRLFRRAPPGIVVPRCEQDRTLIPRSKPRLRKSLTVDEGSEEHLVRLQAAVIDTETVKDQAKRLTSKVLASAQAAQANAEQAAKKEEERVAQLKRERGEEWLPSIAAHISKAPKMLQQPSQVISVGQQTSIATTQKKTKKKKKNSQSSVKVNEVEIEAKSASSGVAEMQVVKEQASACMLTGKASWPQVGVVLV